MLMDAIKPARTLVDQVYDSLLDAICDGRLAPGARLTQDELATQLGVSRQPVMSALAALHREGFAIERGKRGLEVAPVDRARFDAIYELRSALEPLVARLAARRAGPAQRAQLAGLVGEGREVAARGDAGAAIRADVAFHSALYEACGNPLIVATMQSNWQHLRRSMGEVLRRPHFAEQVWREHAAIADAVAAGDAERAGRLMQQHVSSAHDRVGRELARDARFARAADDA